MTILALWKDAMSDRTLMAGACAAASAPRTTSDAPRLLRKAQFLRKHPDISVHCLTRMIDRGQLETVQIASVDRIVEGSYERYVAQQLAGKR